MHFRRVVRIHDVPATATGESSFAVESRISEQVRSHLHRTALVALAAASGAAIFTVVMLVFITQGTWITWLLYPIGCLALFALSSRLLSFFDFCATVPVTALLSVLAEQTLAFSIFPGLAKGIEPFGASHWQQVTLLFCIQLCFCAAMAAAAKRLERGLARRS